MTDQIFLARNWVYNLADYRQIFVLSEQDLQKTILDFPSGISSVNAELYALGHSIVSADPAYHLSAKEMQTRARQFLQEKLAQSRKQELADTVMTAWRQSCELFLADYELGKQQGRYRALSAPPTPPAEQTFEILLCTDFLFNSTALSTYSPQDLINELCKLAVEIQVFPIPDAKTAVAAELGPIMLAFQQRNFGVEIRAVNFPERGNGSATLRIWAKECEVNNS